MFRKVLCASLFVFSTTNADQLELPKIIDYAGLELRTDFYHGDPASWTWKLANSAYESGLLAFNGASEMGSFFMLLNKTYPIDAIVETGTERGSTTQFFARCFKQVHSIDLSEPSYYRAKDVFRDQQHVNLYCGNSPEVLREILPGLKDKTLAFFLDAHWNNYWPLSDELEEISKTHKDNCIIVVDDFKVPGRADIPFDGYNHNGVYKESSYSFIKDKLNKIFTSYSVHYIIPKNPGHRAKFVAIPNMMVQRSPTDYYNPLSHE